jgi:hypothetical protein
MDQKPLTKKMQSRVRTSGVKEHSDEPQGLHEPSKFKSLDKSLSTSVDSGARTPSVTAVGGAEDAMEASG